MNPYPPPRCYLLRNGGAPPVIGQNARGAWLLVSSEFRRFLVRFVVLVWQAETMKIIDECNGHWKSLVDGKTEAGKMWIK